jgi:hypothetical protein
MTSLKDKMAATLAAKQLAAADSQTQAAQTTTEGTDTDGTTQEGAVTIESLTAEDSVDLQVTGSSELYQAASLPVEVLESIMSKQEFAGLTGPIVEGSTAENTISELQAARAAVMEGSSSMPLEAIDRAINEIQSNSDALMWEQHRQKEDEEHQLRVAESEAQVLAISLAGGDVAAVPVLPTSRTRQAGDYSFIYGEKDATGIDANITDPLSVVGTTFKFLSGVRSLLAAHNTTIARMNPFAGSQINDTVVQLDSYLTALADCYKEGTGESLLPNSGVDANDN